MDVTATVNDEETAAEITWQAPDPNAVGITEGFESETFPPTGWTQVITNTGAANTLGIYPTWCRIGAVTISGDEVNPTEGSYQTGLFWAYDHQDEWLITPGFNCPPAAYLSFDSHVYLGSTNGDHYYVKVSSDNGQTWIALWDASAQAPGWNEYSSPITVDLSAYSGNQIKVAFHAIDPPDQGGLWYTWFIDNVYIGNSETKVVFDTDDLVRVSASANSSRPAGTMPMMTLSRSHQEGDLRAETRMPRLGEIRQARKDSRALVGYKVYRLMAGYEQIESTWTLVNPETITGLSITDPAWQTLPNGNYRWAVKAVYTNDVLSAPSLSNVLNKFVQTGMIIGTVRNKDNIPIVGATVTTGEYSATTNIIGAYSIALPVGTYDVTASAEGYSSSPSRIRPCIQTVTPR